MVKKELDNSVPTSEEIKSSRENTESQTKLSSKEIENSNKIWLVPAKSVNPRENFNEKFREEYNFQKEYVQFIAENKEIIGETIDIWTKKFAGQPAEYWNVPCNKPVWGPRYLAEQIKSRSYKRWTMSDPMAANPRIRGYNRVGADVGGLEVETVIQRMDAVPVSNRKSVFMGEAAKSAI